MAADASVIMRRLRALRRALGRTRLGARLAVLSAGLAAAVVCGTFAALSVQVRNTTRDLFAEAVARNQRTLVELQRDNRRRQVLTAGLLAESPTLRSAMATYRIESRDGRHVRADLTNTVRRELEHLGRDLNAGALLAIDERGRVLASYVSAGAEPALRTNLSALSAVRNALDPSVVSTRGETYLSGLELGDAYYSVGAAPIILDGYTIGGLVYGTRVDSAFVATLGAQFHGDIVASAGAHVISATLAPDAAHVIAAQAIDTAGHSIAIGGAEFIVAAASMGQTQRGTEIRLNLVQPLTPTLDRVASALRRDFILYGALAVMLATLGAVLLARSLLQPLRAFIAYMRSGAEQERIEQPFDAEEAALELRTLNDSFTQLMIALGRQRGALERRGAQLAAANEVLTDEIRERQRVEDALRESEAQLRQSQKLEAIGTLAGGVAHDFNNLLTVISGFTQLALSRIGKGHEVADDLKQVIDASNSAARLTQQLLAFSRKQVLQPRVLDLEETVSAMYPMLRRLIGASIELRVVSGDRPARIKADPGQLEQVLLNLAVNARDAMPHGGTLAIETGHETDGSGLSHVTLRVSDTGIGMAPEVRDRVFEPFFTTKEAGKGTGLGLSTVYGVVSQSGGSVSVESAPGQGATFIVRFPPAVEQTPAEHDANDDAPAPTGTETILLVEDDEAIRALAAQALTAAGYTVVLAPSSVEALTVVRTMPELDVLLTDIVMPQLSGLQLAERVRARHVDVCVVYMTGWVDDSVMRLELETDVALIRKPFTPLELARAVRGALDQQHAIGQRNGAAAAKRGVA
ncbi:MAG TPA: ATP-binding protein [Gemmatimonadaceae bacterium]